jgi:hypothetical protein
MCMSHCALPNTQNIHFTTHFRPLLPTYCCNHKKLIIQLKMSIASHHKPVCYDTYVSNLLWFWCWCNILRRLFRKLQKAKIWKYYLHIDTECDPYSMWACCLIANWMLSVLCACQQCISKSGVPVRSYHSVIRINIRN